MAASKDKEPIVEINVSDDNVQTGRVIYETKHCGRPAIFVVAENEISVDDLEGAWLDKIGEMANAEGKRVVLTYAGKELCWADPAHEIRTEGKPLDPDTVVKDQPVVEAPLRDVVGKHGWEVLKDLKLSEGASVSVTPSPEYEVAQALYWCMQHNVHITMRPGADSAVQLDLDWFSADANQSDAGHISLSRPNFLDAAKAMQAYLNSINYGANTVI